MLFPHSCLSTIVKYINAYLTPAIQNDKMMINIIVCSCVFLFCGFFFCSIFCLNSPSLDFFFFWNETLTTDGVNLIKIKSSYFNETIKCAYHFTKSKLNEEKHWRVNCTSVCTLYTLHSTLYIHMNVMKFDALSWKHSICINSDIVLWKRATIFISIFKWSS